MIKILKNFGVTISVLLSVFVIYMMYTLNWSVKYSVGDCLKNGDEIYLFDKDGPILKGSYGLKLLLPKERRSEYGVAYPRESVEGENFQKIKCPIDELSEEDISLVKKIIVN